jgi:hypothetical protein
MVVFYFVKLEWKSLFDTTAKNYLALELREKTIRNYWFRDRAFLTNP